MRSHWASKTIMCEAAHVVCIYQLLSISILLHNSNSVWYLHLEQLLSNMPQVKRYHFTCSGLHHSQDIEYNPKFNQEGMLLMSDAFSLNFGAISVVFLHWIL